MRALFLRSSAVLAVITLAAILAAPSAADSTRTLRLEYSARTPFAVENLAGTMRVVPGSGDSVEAVATIHAENDSLMNLVRFEQVTGESGVTTLRVIYPTDDYSTFRYPGDDEEGSWVGRLFRGSSSTNTKYAGRRVKVSRGHGVLLYADVEVRMPRRNVEASFRNVVGTIHGEGLRGTLNFDTGSGDVTLLGLTGRISADTGSGRIEASDVEGSFSGDTGSGHIALSHFRGSRIRCDTGSGDIRIKTARADKIEADTGSGDIEIESAAAGEIEADTGSGDINVVDADVERFNGDTGSGNITLEASGARLLRVEADTGSGNVRLRLARDAAFEAMADLGSGRIRNGFSDAEPILRQKEIVGYRRGDGRIKIDVDTGSGSLYLEPGS